jgi:hypothetical protein
MSSSATTNTKKRKADVYEDEDNTSVVYFLVVCHGIYVFKDGNPEYVEIPKTIQYVNKITYAPFGFKNILPSAQSIIKN